MFEERRVLIVKGGCKNCDHKVVSAYNWLHMTRPAFKFSFFATITSVDKSSIVLLISFYEGVEFRCKSVNVKVDRGEIPPKFIFHCY